MIIFVNVELFQVLLNQSCQGSNDPNQEVNIRLRPVDGKQSAGCAKDDTLTDRIQKDVHQSLGYEETDALGIPAASSIDETSQIIVKRPNTAVISATPPSFSAFRQLFLFFMAQQFRQADGETTLESMVNSCSRMMSQQSDVLYRAQAPSLQSVMRNNLILPKALMYDNKVENRGGCIIIAKTLAEEPRLPYPRTSSQTPAASSYVTYLVRIALVLT